MTLQARVLERSGAMGLLMLAGTPLSAALPADLPAGARLRLRVEQIDRERVVLHVLEVLTRPAPPAADERASEASPPGPAGAQAPSQQTGQVPPSAVGLPLPGGLHAEVRVTGWSGEKRQEGEPAAVTLSYESPVLGTLDLQLVHQPGAGLHVTVRPVAGTAEEHIRRAVDELRSALTGATGLPATVRVVPKPPEPAVDVYA
jgi:hypothetical protein